MSLGFHHSSPDSGRDADPAPLCIALMGPSGGFAALKSLLAAGSEEA